MAIDALPDLPFYTCAPTVAMYNDSPITDDLRTAGLAVDLEWLHISYSMLTDRFRDHAASRIDTITATAHVGLGFWLGVRYDGRFGGDVVQMAEHAATGLSYYEGLDYEKSVIQPVVGYQFETGPLLVGCSVAPDLIQARAELYHRFSNKVRVAGGWEQHCLLDMNQTWHDVLDVEQGPMAIVGYDGEHWGSQIQVQLHRVYWRVSYSF